jgi:hypothetical protein
LLNACRNHASERRTPIVKALLRRAC